MVTSATDRWNKRAIYSTMPPVSNRHGRAQSSHGPNTAATSAPVLNRWNSTSKMSDMSSKYNSGRTQSMRDSATFDSNRESMRALSDFLMRSEPPPSNFMSRPDSDAGSLHSIKKSTFKIFGRQKSKKAAKRPKLMQLPDSAVAAKTIGGARHIAISIPIEYDYPYYEAPAQSLPPPRPPSQPKLSTDRGAVTVLKPVAEVRESVSSFLTKAKSDEELDHDKKNSHTEPLITPAAEVLGPETTRTLENYYTLLNRQQRNRPKSSNAEGKLTLKADSTRTQKSYVALSPVDIIRPDSTRTDPRHSGGTAYSTASIRTYPAHSRGPSNASNAPSATMISGLKLDPPPRKSSVTKVSPAIQTELSKAYLAYNMSVIEEPAKTPFMSEKSALSANESTTSERSTSHSPPADLGTVEAAQIHNAAADLQTISRNNTPELLLLASPAPTRQLPDVPESPCIPSFLPSPSPPISQKNSPTIRVIEGAVKPKATSLGKSTGDATRQSRQDRVKARKQRDMAIHRDNSSPRDKEGNRAPLTETTSSTNPQILVTTPPRSAKRRSVSQETARKRALNSITDIMLVADLAPYTGLVRVEDLPLIPSSERTMKRKVRGSDSNGNMSARGTHTPPSSSMDSESDTATQVRRVVRSRERNSYTLDARRQERRVKRNMSLREKEVDARLRKVERDNAMLLSTLSGIANSFGELSRALPRARRRFRKDGGMLTDVEREMREGGHEEMVKGELTKLDPVMRELELGAGKLSQESLKGSKGSVDDYDVA